MTYMYQRWWSPDPGSLFSLQCQGHILFVYTSPPPQGAAIVSSSFDFFLHGLFLSLPPGMCLVKYNVLPALTWGQDLGGSKFVGRMVLQSLCHPLCRWQNYGLVPMVQWAFARKVSVKVYVIRALGMWQKYGFSSPWSNFSFACKVK